VIRELIAARLETVGDGVQASAEFFRPAVCLAPDEFRGLKIVHANTSERFEYPVARDTKRRVYANEVCGCTLADTSDAEYCSEYCSGEGSGRGEGTCQCGHVGCW